MPIFEYQCGACGNQFELLVIHSSAPPECPACHGRDLHKLMSPSAVSSAYTQKRAIREAQARTEKVRFDREYETHKEIHDHEH